MATAYRRNAAVETAPMEGETLLYHSSTKTYCKLNGTAAFLWDALAEPQTIEELAGGICDSYDSVDQEHAVADVEAAISELLELSFVEET